MWPVSDEIIPITTYGETKYSDIPNNVAVILKNNVPRYILMEFSRFQKEELAGEEEVDIVARRILAKNRLAFEELAK